MYVLGVTGGLGSGKTTAARLFGDMGAVVIDLDHLAKTLIEPEGPLVDDVVQAFGEAVLAQDGGVDRRVLADVAFASPANARKLDAIVHPAVHAATVGALDMLRELPEPPSIVVLDVPLLVEAPEFFDVVDGVLTISADEDTRLARAVSRGMTEEQARARVACQASDAERREIADHVIENDEDLITFQRQLVRFWDEELATREA